MKALLVYPKFPTTYWGFQYGMPLIDKRASLPPLGLISLAALLPPSWQLRLVDLNVQPLKDDDLRWCEVVLVGGMRIQAPSMHEVLARARALGRRTVVGGPAPTTAPSEFADADIIFQGEAEGRIESLLEALEAPVGAVRVVSGGERPPMSSVPVPRFDLLDLSQYASISVQYSRGCPFRCEFCDIIEIFGRVPRVKQPQQMLAELACLHRLGYRGSLFVVDDNFIGNRVQVRKLLADLTVWQRQHGYPYELYTEASVNLAADDALVASMVEAGFASVFLGIETPSTAALAEAGKRQNVEVDLRAAVEKLTAAGLEVMGGFIVGFDSDDAQAFEQQWRFIESVPLPLAMVGLLTALPGTALWRRLEREGRLRRSSNGDAFGRPNFEPAMDEALLLRGYRALLEQLYRPEAYYRRCEAYIDRAGKTPGRKRPSLAHVATLLRTMLVVGLRSPRRRHYWRLLARALWRAPHNFAWAVGHVVMGEHMIRYTQEDVLPRIDRALEEVLGQQRFRAARPLAPARNRPAAAPTDEAVSLSAM